jgi:sugar lactone lactonase YvrE
LCLDAAGALWVAQPLASRFVRIDTRGHIVASLDSPAPFAIACTLGGPERTTLFLSSAHTSLAELAQGKSRGRIDALRVAHGGAGWP